MKNTQTNKKAFSIVLAMWITIILWMISILILEYIIPFSRNIKWVENSSSAFYHWYSWIEESLWKLSQNNIWYDNDNLFNPSSATWSQFILKSLTSTIPPLWDWNSEYDSDWNRLDPNIPIQLQLQTGSIDFVTNTDFIFRIPDLNRDGNYTNDGTLSWSNDKPMINWILTGLDIAIIGQPVSLIGEDHLTNNNYIKLSDINNTAINIWSKNWVDLDWKKCTLQEFYSDNCLPETWSGIAAEHTLKLSLLDDLEMVTAVWERRIPYLEYQILFKDSSNADVQVPGRYSQIDTAGKSYGYKKTMDIKVPQLSTNQAFDFAVFQ